MTSEEMEKFIVRYSDLKPCKTAFIDAQRLAQIKKKILQLLVLGFLKALINMFILRKLLALILVQLVSPQAALIHCTLTQQQKFFMSLKESGVSFGVVMEKMVK